MRYVQLNDIYLNIFTMLIGRSVPNAVVAKLHGSAGHRHFLLATEIEAIHLAVTRFCTNKRINYKRISSGTEGLTQRKSASEAVLGHGPQPTLEAPQRSCRRFYPA